MEPARPPRFDASFARRVLIVLRVVYGLLVVALPLLAFLAMQLAAAPVPGGPWAAPPAPAGSSLVVLVVLAIGTALVIPLLRRRLLPAALRGRGGEAAPEAVPAALRGRGGEAAPEAVPAAFAVRPLGKYLAAQLVSWGLCLAIGGFGVAATLLGRKPLYAAAFAVGALANLAMVAPRRADLAAIWRAAEARAGEATRTDADDPRRP